MYLLVGFFPEKNKTKMATCGPHSALPTCTALWPPHDEPLSQLNVASIAAEAAFDAMYVTVQLYTCAAAKCCNVIPAGLRPELAMPIGDAKRAVVSVTPSPDSVKPPGGV